MKTKKKIIWFLGFVSTISGILSLPGSINAFFAWLSFFSGKKIVFNNFNILYLGIALFPSYLIFDFLFSLHRKKVSEKVERLVKEKIIKEQLIKNPKLVKTISINDSASIDYVLSDVGIEKIYEDLTMHA